MEKPPRKEASEQQPKATRVLSGFEQRWGICCEALASTWCGNLSQKFCISVIYYVHYLAEYNRAKDAAGTTATYHFQSETLA